MPKVGVDMKLSNIRSKLKNLSIKKIKDPEQLTDKDLAELMGVNRDTYTRGKGGSVRRK